MGRGESLFIKPQGTQVFLTASPGAQGYQLQTTGAALSPWVMGSLLPSGGSIVHVKLQDTQG